MHIEFRGCEGYDDWSCKRLPSFAHANNELLYRAKVLQDDGESGGYFKHNFAVIDDAGEEIYSGRYDLHPLGTKTDEDTDTPDLYKHIVDYMLFLSGQHRPGHLSEDRYMAIVRDMGITVSEANSLIAQLEPIKGEL